jgi:hypothetical protein
LALVEGPGVEGGREIRGVIDTEDADGEEEEVGKEGEVEWAWEVLEDVMFGGKGGEKETWEEVRERVREKVEERQRKDGEKGADREAGEEQEKEQEKEHEGSEETFFPPRDEL